MVIFCLHMLKIMLSSIKFLKHLQDFHKGDHVKDTHQLKIYLKNYDYLNYNHTKNHTKTNDVKTYQLNFHLKINGYLDFQTVSTMSSDVIDIINGSTLMYFGQKWAKHSFKFHAISHYSFFPNNPQVSRTNPFFYDPMKRAFWTWCSGIHFTFSDRGDYYNTDLTISFYHGTHGDGSLFDGLGGTLAYTFALTDGCYIMMRTKHQPASRSQTLLTLIRLHCIKYSSIQDAIVYLDIFPGTTKRLNGDDIVGIKTLYKF
ncbi:Peptidase M10, metallopeptidase [Dillenia turbinata]|uniref:Peptidase M10, metallopeptidase n=1 Tax=Dillenia turbinata TaxID=194707 RepID=A0AAN8VJ15_9MAGN